MKSDPPIQSRSRRIFTFLALILIFLCYDTTRLNKRRSNNNSSERPPKISSHDSIETKAAWRLRELYQEIAQKNKYNEQQLAAFESSLTLEAYIARLYIIYEKYLAPLHQDEEKSRHVIAWEAVLNKLRLAEDPKSGQSAIPHMITTSIKDKNDVPPSFAKWKEHHPDWSIELYDDEDMEKYMDDTFSSLGYQRYKKKPTNKKPAPQYLLEWLDLPYPILRVDAFRYFKLFFEGGVYADSDTASMYPISEWPGIQESHANETEMGDAQLRQIERMPWMTSTTQEPDWTPPGLVISIEFDAQKRKDRYWRLAQVSRPLQMTQFAFLAEKYHPVMLDCIGSVMEKAASHRASPRKVKMKHKFQSLILDWSGPGLFTDAVFRYIVARHGIDPFKLAGMKDKSARIGDVLIYPEFSFAASNAQNRYRMEFELVHHEYISLF